MKYVYTGMIGSVLALQSSLSARNVHILHIPLSQASSALMFVSHCWDLIVDVQKVQYVHV